jgi:hypothetical protein
VKFALIRRVIGGRKEKHKARKLVSPDAGKLGSGEARKPGNQKPPGFQAYRPPGFYASKLSSGI